MFRQSVQFLIFFGVCGRETTRPILLYTNIYDAPCGCVIFGRCGMHNFVLKACECMYSLVLYRTYVHVVFVRA